MQDPSWPSFLELLDLDPDGAFADFYEYAMIILAARPPRPLMSLNPEDRQDCLHDIVFHCVKDDFRVLRRYANVGKPFSAWLYVIAHNMAMDLIDKLQKRRGIEIQPKDTWDGPEPEPSPVGTGGNSGNDGDLNGLIEQVKELIRQLGDECRVLLEMAADGLRPVEMVKVLALPPDQNKKISDHLRYCRKKLKKSLVEAGYDLKSYISCNPRPRKRRG